LVAPQLRVLSRWRDREEAFDDKTMLKMHAPGHSKELAGAR
jgi:hypothetical protein